MPADAEAHRGGPARFVVVPAHLNGDIVVKAADRFFVVEVRGQTTRPSWSGLQ